VQSRSLVLGTCPVVIFTVLSLAWVEPSWPEAGVTLGDSPSADAVALYPDGIDLALVDLPDHVETILQSSGLPGLAVAVVHEGETVFAQGFGTRDGENPVTPETVFQIASLSKPLAATVAAIQVSEGQISWQDPVVDYLEGFELSDPYVTEQVTIGDFFAHRSGLPMAAGDELEDLGFARTDIIERLALMPLDPFRSTYHYANYGITIGAEAVASAAGMDWETLSDTVLYQPLGMTSTSSRRADFLEQENRAILHTYENGVFEALYERDPDPQSPAGGVSSSVVDMAEWMKLILAEGVYEGEPLVDPAALLPALTPQSVSTRSRQAEARSGFYGYGFGVGVTASGRTTLSHSGAFALGAATHVHFLPSADLAIIVLTNGGPIGIPEAVAAQFMDIVQFGSATRDWSAGYAQAMSPLYAPAGDLAGETAPEDPEPPFSLDAYTGLYQNEYYGQAEVKILDDALVLVLGPEQILFPLDSWDGHQFAISPSNENAPAGTRSSVLFAVEDERTTGFVVPFWDTHGLGTWAR